MSTEALDRMKRLDDLRAPLDRRPPLSTRMAAAVARLNLAAADVTRIADELDALALMGSAERRPA